LPVSKKGLGVRSVDRATFLRHHREHVNRGFADLAALLDMPAEVRSDGAIVYDEQDIPYLDCGGYGAFLLGHRHPDVVSAVADQLGRHPMSTRGLLEPTVVRAARSLATVTPAGLQYTCFTSSGTEAVELALKLAAANGRRRVVAAGGGSHGAALADAHLVPYDDLPAMRSALAGSRGDPCCVLVEPVQAEGGVRIPREGYLAGVRTLCRRFGALLVVDEVHSGLGRLGSWWGCDQEDVTPDLLTVGKVLSGGVIPVAATVATAEVFDVLNRDPSPHSWAFGGNPLAAVAATSTIEVLQREKVPERAGDLGAHLLPEIEAALRPAGPDRVRAVRGRGLLIGAELATPRLAVAFTIGMLRAKVLTSYTLNSSEVIRLTPAVLESDQIDWLLRALRDTATMLASD
jgi:putrescine aminotransferase